MRIAVWREIEAPVETVFRTIADIEALPAVNPDVESIEFLSERRSGPGTRFKETRVGKRRKVVTELEVVEQVENERVRFVSDLGGVIWDTNFRFRPEGGGSRLDIELEARPHKLLPRIISPLMKRMIRSGMEKHIDSVKDRCEEMGRE